MAAAAAATAAVKGPLHISAEAGVHGADKQSRSSHKTSLEVGIIGPVDFFGTETVPDTGAGNKGGGVAHGAVLGLIPASCTVSVASLGGCELMLLTWRDLQWLSKETQAAIRGHVAQRSEWWNTRAESLAAKLPPREIAAAAAAAGKAKAEAAETKGEADAEALAAEPAENVVKNDLRPTAKVSFFAKSNHKKSRPGTASGTGKVVPFGVDGLGSYHGVASGAAKRTHADERMNPSPIVANSIAPPLPLLLEVT